MSYFFNYSDKNINLYKNPQSNYNSVEYQQFFIEYMNNFVTNCMYTSTQTNL